MVLVRSYKRKCEFTPFHQNVSKENLTEFSKMDVTLMKNLKMTGISIFSQANLLLLKIRSLFSCDINSFYELKYLIPHGITQQTDNEMLTRKKTWNLL